MERNLDKLSKTAFDLLIVGGGVYGAAAAWEAALRGLSVALVEAADFGGATSANSQKIVHGGLRYLQTLDFARMRESVRERSLLLRHAPHAVVPLPCLMPTRQTGTKSRPVMAAALWANDRISSDRNRHHDDPATRIPNSRVVSREECFRLFPTLRRDGVTGAAVWYDGQILNTERLTFAYILGAVEHGAEAANYVRVTELLRENGHVAGARVQDALSGRRFEIRSRVVLNTAGPWMARLLEPATQPPSSSKASGRAFLKAVNLITRPLYGRKVALGLANPVRSATSLGLIFFTPWRDRTIIGTAYTPYAGDPDQCGVSEEEIRVFVREVNAAFPAARLIREDVSYVHFGLLPAARAGKPGERVPLRKHYQLIDHEKSEGVRGLVSVIGVKFTTARDVAEQALRCVMRKLGKDAGESPSRKTPLFGGNINRIDEFLSNESRSRPKGLHPTIVKQLIHSYGSRYRDVLAWIDEDRTLAEPVVGSSEVIRAQVLHAVRKEAAQKLSDVVFRRTDLGTVGHPGEACLRECAEIMAAELKWDAARVQDELAQTRAEFRRHACMPEDAHRAAPAVDVKIRYPKAAR